MIAETTSAPYSELISYFLKDFFYVDQFKSLYWSYYSIAQFHVLFLTTRQVGSQLPDGMKPMPPALEGKSQSLDHQRSP